MLKDNIDTFMYDCNDADENIENIIENNIENNNFKIVDIARRRDYLTGSPNFIDNFFKPLINLVFSRTKTKE